jgi:hypothetical protein
MKNRFCSKGLVLTDKMQKMDKDEDALAVTRKLSQNLLNA